MIGTSKGNIERPSFGEIFIMDKYKIWGWNSIVIVIGIFIFIYGVFFL